MNEAKEGGCLCGAIRYQIASIFDVVYCHCGRCRRRSGAPVYLSVVVRREHFSLLRGAPAVYASSSIGANHFCGICGAPICFVQREIPYVSVAHGSLDDPASVQPQAHQWTMNALPWLRIDDQLSHFPDGRLTHPLLRPIS